jgi:hypothetical protein
MVAVLIFNQTEYPISLGEARVLRKNIKEQHPELALLIEVLGNEIAGDAQRLDLDGIAARAVWDAVQVMNPPYGSWDPGFHRLYEALRIEFS